MDCIPYINDLQTEIDILKDVKSVNKEDKIIEIKIKEKEELLNKCKENLAKLSKTKIEYRLYLKIINGMTPSKAVKEIADENYKNGIKPTDVTYIWKNYYKKIKKFIKSQ
ncbi:MAG: hypothetical protein V8Q75_03485 [Bacilli bacterium]